MTASSASHRRAAFAAISAHTRRRSAGELEIAAKIPAVAACCSRPSASSPLAWESSLVSSWILRSAEARPSVGEAVMTTRFPYNLPIRVRADCWLRLQLGRTRMLRDMVARWNVQQVHSAPGAYPLPLVNAASPCRWSPPAPAEAQRRLHDAGGLRPGLRSPPIRESPSLGIVGLPRIDVAALAAGSTKNTWNLANPTGGWSEPF